MHRTNHCTTRVIRWLPFASPESTASLICQRANILIRTHLSRFHLKVVGTSKDTTPVAKPRSTPEVDTVWGAVAFMTTSFPPPGGSANKVADGIVSCPALEGAWQ